MKVIISPAKSITLSEFKIDFATTRPFFLENANQLVKKLQKFKPKKLKDLYHVSEDIANLNYERFQNWDFDYSDSSYTVISSFSGEVYRGINFETIDPKHYQHLQDQLFILSGLYGVLRPFDVFNPYRLEMGTKWEQSPKVKNLYQYWKHKPLDFIQSNMEKDEVLVNLASTEYSKVLDLKKTKVKVVTPVFKEFKNGKYSVVMMYAKHARGAMARWIIENQIEELEMLKTYQVDGYQWDAAQSTAEEFVFTR